VPMIFNIGTFSSWNEKVVKLIMGHDSWASSKY
jgi:hypothetical protein